MPPESGETRTLYVPRTGTKVSLLVGLALLLAAIYVGVMPLSVPSKSGPNFGCGTALSPNDDAFAKGYCTAVDQAGRYRTFALGGGGILFAAAGAALFGFDTSTRTRKPRPGFDDDYDDDDNLRPRGRRNNGGPAREADMADAEGHSERPRSRPVPAGSSGASVAPRRSVSTPDSRSAADSVPADAEYDQSTVDEAPRSSLRRPFGDRLADRNRARVDVVEEYDDEYDELDGPRGRR